MKHRDAAFVSADESVVQFFLLLDECLVVKGFELIGVEEYVLDRVQELRIPQLVQTHLLKPLTLIINLDGIGASRSRKNVIGLEGCEVIEDVVPSHGIGER